MVQLRLLVEKIDALSLRERAIVLAGVIIVMFMLWDTFLLQPQVIEERKLLAALQLKRAEQAVLNIRLQELLKQDQVGSAAAGRGRLEELKQQLSQAEAEVKQSTSHLVDADKMAVILQTILSRSRGLELIEIKGLGVNPLIETTTDVAEIDESVNTPAGGLDNAWKHGLVIRLEGDYMSTLNYIRELEALEWGFFWENIEYEVTEYPRGTLAITLYTLSLEKDWIGV